MPVIGSRGGASLKSFGFTLGGASRPSAPSIGTVTRSSGAISIPFTPGFNGGSAVTRYTVTATPGGATFTGASSPITATGLTLDTSYTFTVTATNAIGTSVPSGSSNSLKFAQVPYAPTAVTAAVASITSASVTYTAPAPSGDAITSYTATAYAGGSSTGITGTVNQAGSGTIAVGGLTSGTPYTFVVHATNSLGAGTPSAQSNSITLPVPTYAVSASGGATSVNEGSAMVFNVTGTNITNGTYYWAVTNSGDFGTSSGTFSILNNTGTFSVTPTADLLTEGPETFTASIYATSNINGTALATSSSITINDTSKVTYAFSTIPASINEGASGTFAITTVNVPVGTTLYWTVSDVDTVAADFTATSGSFTTGGTLAAGTGSFSVGIVADSLTEGPQYFSVQVRTGSTAGTIVTSTGFSYIIINDTSMATPTYSIAPLDTSVNEGFVVPCVITTTSVPNGTTLWWNITGGTATAADFTASSGSVTVNSNSASFDVATKADVLTEGTNETFSVQVRTGGASGTVVATSATITIMDTSKTPAATFGTVPTSINEGTSGRFTFTTTNIPDYASLTWTVNNGTTNSADFSSSSGTVSVVSGAGSFDVVPTADYVTEGVGGDGAETFTVSISTSTGTVLATSRSVTVNDAYIEIVSGVGSTFTIGAAQSYSISGARGGSSVSYRWAGILPSGSTATTITGTVNPLSATGTGTISFTPAQPGSYTLTVTFAASGNVITFSLKSLIKATFTNGVVTLTVPGTAQRRIGLTNNTGYGSLGYELSGYTASAQSPRTASGTILGSAEGISIYLANPHDGGTATMTLTQTNQADTTLTLAIPAQVTYGWAEFKTEYNLTDAQISFAQNTVLPYYTSNAAYTTTLATTNKTRYGLYRNPDTVGMNSYARMTTFNATVFFAGVTGTTDPTRANTAGKTGYLTGTGYNIFFNRGTP